jgi:chromate transporter
VLGVFLRLGVTAFGGPAAHTAMMRDELVRRRGWADDARFLDLMAATTLIPGPNSTELALHLGHERARWRGFCAAGFAFIVPAVLITVGFGWLYAEYGSTPVAEGLLRGVQPVVLAVIAHAVVGLTPVAVKGWQTAVLGAAAFAAALAGVPELAVLAAAVALALAAGLAPSARAGLRSWVLPPVLLLAAAGYGDRGDLATLFWTMLRIGAVLYGSGYVLVAFLDGAFVEGLGWLSPQELLDAVAVGQVTPGPVFSTATFVGFLVAGPAGAAVATVAIFLPAFAFVALLTRYGDSARERAWVRRALDGATVASLALMAAVCVRLGVEALADPLGWVLAGAALALLLRTSVSSVWLVAAGAAIGVAARLL